MRFGHKTHNSQTPSFPGLFNFFFIALWSRSWLWTCSNFALSFSFIKILGMGSVTILLQPHCLCFLTQLWRAVSTQQRRTLSDKLLKALMVLNLSIWWRPKKSRKRGMEIWLTHQVEPWKTPYTVTRAWEATARNTLGEALRTYVTTTKTFSSVLCYFILAWLFIKTLERRQTSTSIKKSSFNQTSNDLDVYCKKWRTGKDETIFICVFWGSPAYKTPKRNICAVIAWY